MLPLIHSEKKIQSPWKLYRENRCRLYIAWARSPGAAHVSFSSAPLVTCN